MAQGWICLHRALLEWEWYGDINATRLFIHLLLKANHKPGKWRGITIERGQHLTSLDTLSKETNLSVSKIRTAIKNLISTGELAKESHSQHTVFIMKNYESYQAVNKPIDKPITNESQTDRKPIATNNNDNNVNHDKNEVIKYKDLLTKEPVNQDHNLDLLEPAQLEKQKAVKNKTAEVLEIFDYWLDVMRKPRSVTKSKKRIKAIEGRLKDGYTVEQIKKAIDGCKADAFSMGQNDRAKPYNDIELICRTSEKVDHFMEDTVIQVNQKRDINAISTSFEVPEGFNRK